MSPMIWRMKPRGSALVASFPQRSHPWWVWEDHKDGMYTLAAGWQAKIPEARELLADPGRLEPAMQAVIDAWPISAEHQLTNTEQNRRAWLGQAACRLSIRAPALATRAAWPQLTDDQRAAANACAARVIREWETDHAGGQSALFCGDDGVIWDV
jgi:hypothetical protein